MDSTEIQRIMRRYNEQLYTNKLDNLKEMDTFLETYTLPRPSQEEIGNQNLPITTNKIKSVIKNLPQSKSPEPDGFIGEFYQTFKELTPILLKLFQKIQEEERLFKFLYEATITLIPKPDRHYKKRKL